MCSELNDSKYCYVSLTIQLNISHLFAHSLNVKLWPIDSTLSGATTPGQSGPEGEGNEGVLHIPQISKAGASPSDCLMSYPAHFLVCSVCVCGGGVSYPSAEMQSVYFTAQADRAEKHDVFKM